MPPTTQTVECGRCGARGQLESWAERGMLPMGWHYQLGGEGIECPSCWQAAHIARLARARQWLANQTRVQADFYPEGSAHG